MVSTKTIRNVIYYTSLVVLMIFLIFIVKVPLACAACDDQVGLWYRCLSGGAGTSTCEDSANVTAGIKAIVQELIDVGIHLPSQLLESVIYIKNKIVALAQEIFDAIAYVVSGAYNGIAYVIKNYIINPVVTAADFIKTSVVLPLVQGVATYILQPIQSLLQEIIGFKDTAFNAIKSAFSAVKGIAVDVWDYTFGALVEGFDQIPYGLVDFIEIIQNVLNTLKNGIIGDKPANDTDIPTKGINKFLKLLMIGLQETINFLGEGVNLAIIDPVIDGVINPVISVLNMWPIKAGIAPLSDKVIPALDFGTKYTGYIPDPPDLFWAGKKSIEESTIVKGGVAGVCPIVCHGLGYDTGTQNMAEGHQNECICNKNVVIPNTNAFMSCTDVCQGVGGVSLTPADPDTVCPVCANELIFQYFPFALPYSVSIAFNGQPFITFKSNVTFDTKIPYPTIGFILSTFQTKLANDINAVLVTKGVDILNQGIINGATTPVTYTNFDTTWFKFETVSSPGSTTTTATNGLISFAFSPTAILELAAVANSINLTSVSMTVNFFFSTNSLFAQAFGFTADASFTSMGTTNKNSTSTLTISSNSSTYLDYYNLYNSLSDKKGYPPATVAPSTIPPQSVTISYPTTPTVSTTPPIPTFIFYNGFNFYFLNGTYYSYMNNIFYRLSDQNLLRTKSSQFQYIQIESNMNCASTFSLHAFPNMNTLKYSYMDLNYNFTESVTLPSCPWTTGETAPPCPDVSNNGIMTQSDFFTTLQKVILADIITYIATIPTVTKDNYYSQLTPPFTFAYTPGTTTSSPVLRCSFNSNVNKGTASLTLHISQNPIMCYNFNGYDDVTFAIQPTLTPVPYLAIAGGTKATYPYLDPTGQFFEITEKTSTTTGNNAIGYSFVDHWNEYNFNGTAYIPPGDYTVDAIGAAFTTALTNDINFNTDNFYNFNPANTSGTSYDASLNSNATLAYSASTANYLTFTYDVNPILTDPNYVIPTTGCLPFVPLPIDFPSTLITTTVEPAWKASDFPSTFVSSVTLGTSTFLESNATVGNMCDTTTPCYNAFITTSSNSTNPVNTFVGCNDKTNEKTCLSIPSTSTHLVHYVDPNVKQSVDYNLYGEWFQVTYTNAFGLSEYMFDPGSWYGSFNASGVYTTNTTNIDMYELWVLGSNDNGATWYKVDSVSNITYVSGNLFVNESSHVYQFYTYRFVITQMLTPMSMSNNTVAFPKGYIMNGITTYSTQGIKQIPSLNPIVTQSVSLKYNYYTATAGLNSATSYNSYDGYISALSCQNLCTADPACARISFYNVNGANGYCNFMGKTDKTTVDGSSTVYTKPSSLTMDTTYYKPTSYKQSVYYYGPTVTSITVGVPPPITPPSTILVPPVIVYNPPILLDTSYFSSSVSSSYAFGLIGGSSGMSNYTAIFSGTNKLFVYDISNNVMNTPTFNPDNTKIITSLGDQLDYIVNNTLWYKNDTTASISNNIFTKNSGSCSLYIKGPFYDVNYTYNINVKVQLGGTDISGTINVWADYDYFASNIGTFTIPNKNDFIFNFKYSYARFIYFNFTTTTAAASLTFKSYKVTKQQISQSNNSITSATCISPNNNIAYYITSALNANTTNFNITITYLAWVHYFSGRNPKDNDDGVYHNSYYASSGGTLADGGDGKVSPSANTSFSITIDFNSNITKATLLSYIKGAIIDYVTANNINLIAPLNAPAITPSPLISLVERTANNSVNVAASKYGKSTPSNNMGGWVFDYTLPTSANLIGDNTVQPYGNQSAHNENGKLSDQGDSDYDKNFITLYSTTYNEPYNEPLVTSNVFTLLDAINGLGCTVDTNNNTVFYCDPSYVNISTLGMLGGDSIYSLGTLGAFVNFSFTMDSGFSDILGCSNTVNFGNTFYRAQAASDMNIDISKYRIEYYIPECTNVCYVSTIGTVTSSNTKASFNTNTANCFTNIYFSTPDTNFTQWTGLTTLNSFTNQSLFVPSMSCSNDGTFISIAAGYNSPGLYSSNAGPNNLTRTSFFDYKYMMKTCMSYDGRYQMASCYKNEQSANCIYISKNYGFSWAICPVFNTASPTIYELINTTPTSSIAISSDGKYMMFGAKGNPDFYISSDYGITWTSKLITNDQISSINISSTGQYIYVYTVSIPYMSFDYGNNFGAFSFSFTNYITNISPDGTNVLNASSVKSALIKLKLTSPSTSPTPLSISGSPSQALSALTLTSSTSINGNNVLSLTSSLDGSTIFVVASSNLYKYNGSVVTTYTDTTLPNASFLGLTTDSSGSVMSLLTLNSGIWNIFNTSASPKWKTTTSTSIVNTATTTAIVWKFIKSSSNGKYQVACSTTNDLYMTEDFGNSWGPVKIPYPASNNVVVWNSFDFSTTGQYVTAVTKQSGVFFSSNYGKSWNNTNWTHDPLNLVAVSSSGKYQIVAGISGIAYSGNYGQDFTLCNTSTSPTAEGFNPVIIVISASGQYSTIASTEYGLYVTGDYGQTWAGFPVVTLTGAFQYSLGSAPTPISKDVAVWNFGIITDFSNLRYDGEIQTIVEDGMYQCFGSNDALYFSNTYGQTWSVSTYSTPYLSGAFSYGSNLDNPTKDTTYMYLINKTSISKYNGFNITSVLHFGTTGTNALIPTCYEKQVSYIPTFTCHAQSTGANVEMAQLKITSLSPTVSTAVGFGNTPPTSLTPITFFDNPTFATGNVKTITLNNMLLLYDSYVPPFCGQDNEVKLSSPPDSVDYAFVSGAYAVGGTMVFPVDPVIDVTGTLVLNSDYTPELVLSTLAFLIQNDIKSKTGLSPLFSFQFISNDTSHAISMKFDSSHKIVASLIIYSSQNIIISNALGANGYDIFISSVEQISVDVTLPSISVINLIEGISTALSDTPADPGQGSGASYTYSVNSPVSGETLQYMASSFSNGVYSSYNGQLELPINGHSVKSLIESILPKLLANDINNNTGNMYALSSTCFKFEVIESGGYATTYFFYMNDYLPYLNVTLYFAKNSTFATYFGLTKDVSVFNINSNLGVTNGSISLEPSLCSYKGLNYIYLKNTNSYYIYIHPYLFKMDEKPSTNLEISVTKDELEQYLVFHTSTNANDVCYYTNKDGVDDFYALILQQYAYNIDTSRFIILDSGTPESNGYTKSTTPDGNLEFYTAPLPQWFLNTDAGTMLEFSTVPYLACPNPLVLSYSYVSPTKTFTSSVTLPTMVYTNESLGPALSALLVEDLSTKTGKTFASNAVQITYQGKDALGYSVVTRYVFVVQAYPGFQLTLLTSKNPVLAANLGVTKDVVMNTVQPMAISNTNSLFMDPRYIAYSFKDNIYSFTSFVLMATTPTPAEAAKFLSTTIFNEIVLKTGYNYTQNMFSITYANNKFTMVNTFKNTATVTLLFDKTKSPPAPVTIPVSTWASYFGFSANVVITKTPSISTQIPVAINPMVLNYSFQDNMSSTAFKGNVTFLDTEFTTVTNDVGADLIALLLADINSKQTKYVLKPSDIVIQSQLDRVNFYIPTLPISITLNFSTNSMVGINYGCFNDVTMTTFLYTTSTVNAISSFYEYEGLTMYSATVKGKAQFCAYFNALTSDATKYPSGLYNLMPGPNQGLNSVQCNEITLLDLTVPLKSYGYNLIANGAYQKYSWYVYDTATQSLYFLIDQISVMFYGPIDQEGFTPISQCKLDSQGNCIPSDLQLYALYGQQFVIVPLKIRSLLHFSRDTITNPNCPCSLTLVHIPTCNEICSSSNDPDGNPYKCDNSNDDPLQVPCQCYYEGPVNVIIKPMQKYNPFRQIGELVTSAFTGGDGNSGLISSISSALSSFLTPLWNTVKLVVSVLSSVLAMIVEAITTYGNPVYIFNLFKNIIVLGAEELAHQMGLFFSDIIVPALQAIWDVRLPIIEGLSMIGGYIWESLKVALKAISDGLSTFVIKIIDYTGYGISWFWDKLVVGVGAFLDVFTPFIPVGPTIKANVVLYPLIIALLLALLSVIGVTEFLPEIYRVVREFFEVLYDVLIRFFFLVKSIVVETSEAVIKAGEELEETAFG